MYAEDVLLAYSVPALPTVLPPVAYVTDIDGDI